MDDNQSTNQFPELPNSQQVSKWWVLLSGACFTLLGFYFFKSPIESIVTLVYYLAFAKIISGIAGLVVSFKKGENQRKYNLAISIIDLMFGLILLFSPILKIDLIIMLPFILAGWAFARGLLVCISSIKNKEVYKYYVLSFISGVISIIACFVIIAYPIATTLLTMEMIGIFFIIMGFSLLFQFLFLLFKKAE